MRHGKVVFMVILAAFAFFSVLFAQANTSPAVPSLPTDNNTITSPDLTVDAVSFNPQPKEGETINSLLIRLANKGNADAAANKLKLSALVADCPAGKDCDSVAVQIAGELDVPVIKAGESVDLTWSPSAPIKWVAGKYTIVAEVDAYNAVTESNEENNINKTLVYITSLSADSATPMEGSQ